MLPVVLGAVFLYGFDQTVVNVALPTMQRDLHAGPVALELVVGGYAFAYAAVLVTGGRLGDLLGYRRTMMAGLVAFVAASVVCGLAPNAAALVGARFLQGVAAAIMVPQVLALITRVFPPAERRAAIAWFGVTGGVSGVAGQIIGGLLLGADVAGLGWRPLFLINLPVGAIVLFAAARVLRDPGLPPAPAAGASAARRGRLDLAGAAGVSAGVALAIAPFVAGRAAHWAAWVWLPLAAAVPLLAATLAHEARLARGGGRPLLDLTLFAGRTFNAGLGIAIAFLAFFTSSMFTLSLLLQSGLGLSPLRAGLAFVPFAAVALLVTVPGPRLVARLGAAQVIRIGALISAAGLLGMIRVVATGPGVGPLIGALAVVGAGNGLILTTYLGATLSGVRPDQAGVASGTLNTIQQFAGSAGLAGIGAIFFAVLGPAPVPARYAPATSAALWAGLVLVAAVFALTWLLPRTPATPIKRAAAPAAAGRATGVAAERATGAAAVPEGDPVTDRAAGQAAGVGCRP